MAFPCHNDKRVRARAGVEYIKCWDFIVMAFDLLSAQLYDFDEIERKTKSFAPSAQRKRSREEKKNKIKMLSYTLWLNECVSIN